ncbi:MAG: superfamily II DNA or RNA helicase [Planctomycetota bacterium]|jgi:superfamily II DNA or RNA helicase
MPHLIAEDLLSIIAPDIPGPMQARGKKYALNKSIYDVTLYQGWAEATIIGTLAYDVEVDWTTEGAPGCCSCPTYRRAGPCKHMWALAMWLDLAGETQESLESLISEDVRPSRGRRVEPWENKLDLLRLMHAEHQPGFTNPWETSGAECELRYRLEPEIVAENGIAHLHPMLRKPLQSGEWGKLRPVSLEAIDASDLVDPEEVRVFGLLFSYCGISLNPEIRRITQRGERHVALEGGVITDLLPRIARLGKLELNQDSPKKTPLAWDSGPEWQLRRVIQESPTGEASLSAELVRGEERIPLDQVKFAHYSGLFATDSLLGQFDASSSFPWIRAFNHWDGSVSLPLDHAASLREFSQAIAHEEEFESGPATLGEPAPYLYLDPGTSMDKGTRVECRILFQYGPETEIAPADPASSVLIGTERVTRNLTAERRRIAEYIAAGGRRNPRERAIGSDGALPRGLLVEATRSLLHKGWNVTTNGSPLRSAGTFDVSVSTGIDWFDLDGGLRFGEELITFPELLRAHKTNQPMIALKDGSLGVLPEDWLKQWGLVELAPEREGNALRFRGNQGWLLDMLLADRESVQVDEGFARYRENLASFDGVKPQHEGPEFVGELRDYQRDALGWFEFLRNLGLGGCLADDMGLGKTVQVLALLESRRELETKGPTLVVAPRSLIFNWIDEAARFTPKLRVLDYTGPQRKKNREAAGEVDLIITTYGVLRRDAPELSETLFDYVILDEATAIKNSGSQASKASRLLRAEHRLTLTGTPIENHVGELWSQLEFLNPGMLGRSSAFQSLVGKDIPPESRAHLAKALQPFILRRTKGEVLTELPPKSEQILLCELSKEEERRYAELRQHYQASLLGENGAAAGPVEGSKIQVLEALLRLRQAACHPGLIDSACRDESSAKLEVLLPMLKELRAEGHKVLVFSQFTTFLGIVRERLDQEEITYAYLDGSTRKRKEVVESFEKDPDVQVFLISIKAGGHGLNLTSADYVFLLDPWWNPAVESQAVDRAHRLGQTRPVFAYRLIAKNTVEQHILELQEEKRALAESLLAGGQGVLRDLTREDLRALLS